MAEWYTFTTVIKQFSVKDGDRFANCFMDIYPEEDSVLWCMNREKGFINYM